MPKLSHGEWSPWQPSAEHLAQEGPTLMDPLRHRCVFPSPPGPCSLLPQRRRTSEHTWGAGPAWGLAFPHRFAMRCTQLFWLRGGRSPGCWCHHDAVSPALPWEEAAESDMELNIHVEGRVFLVTFTDDPFPFRPGMLPARGAGAVGQRRLDGPTVHAG